MAFKQQKFIKTTWTVLVALTLIGMIVFTLAPLIQS